MNVLPTIAGLKMFAPKPPNTILPKRIATIEPTAPIQSGIVGGSVKANNEPVTNTAMLTFPLGSLRTKMYSVRNANRLHTTNTIATLHPNRYILNRIRGISA